MMENLLQSAQTMMTYDRLPYIGIFFMGMSLIFYGFQLQSTSYEKAVAANLMAVVFGVGSVLCALFT